MDRPLQWALWLSLGVTVGGGTYVWLVADPLFVGVTALFWTLGMGFLDRRSGPTNGASRRLGDGTLVGCCRRADGAGGDPRDQSDAASFG
ncbi:hypothetical protein [Halorhabdus rudnickae]|uniref:hypothetical protein n=1 Tax=Halorhabdus rudnickae TaxID=1775544 RepID=UPI001083698B|nr:hypothetical protein [Halorhabdus rudnickae]